MEEQQQVNVFATGLSLGSTFSEAFIDQYPLDSTVPFRSILFSIIISTLWTLILTFLPVVADIPPDNYYGHHPGWYTGDDVVRFIEPVGGTVLNFIIFYRSGIFKQVDHCKRNQLCVLAFFLALAIYNQGAGFHSCSNMIKNAMQSFDDDKFTNSSNFNQLEYFIRTLWEHIVSHYLYATGYAVMNFCQLYAYRDSKAPILGLTNVSKMFLVISSVSYGVLVAGVAIDFPSGLIVALLYTVLYGLLGIGYYMYREYSVKGDKTILSYGSRPVVHHFFAGNLLALFIIVLWIIVQGGFKTRSQSS